VIHVVGLLHYTDDAVSNQITRFECLTVRHI
jgi:hypothetical protein